MSDYGFAVVFMDLFSSHSVRAGIGGLPVSVNDLKLFCDSVHPLCQALPLVLGMW